MGRLFALLLLSASAQATQVIEVHSGDSLTVLEQGKPLKLHLADVEAPKLDQPYGLAARRSLENLCKSKNASYQRPPGPKTKVIRAVVLCADVDAGRMQLKRGLAWVRPGPKTDPALTLIQDFVWRDGIGLWADANPVPPWEWTESKNQR